MATSVFFALKNAIYSARADDIREGKDENSGVEESIVPVFKLDSPATAERIRMACSDQLTKMVIKFVNSIIEERGAFPV